MINQYDNFSENFLVDTHDSSFHNYDPTFDISYKIFLENFTDQFQNALNIDSKLFTPVTFRSKTFQNYMKAFYTAHIDLMSACSDIVKELYFLHQTSQALYKFNSDEIKMSHVQFRSHFYFPNIVYLLVRYLPNARNFLQKTIKNAYYSIQKKNSNLTYLYENAIYTDVDVIRTDILYTFLGNSIKKINPLIVKNIKKFYKQVFLNHFFYYFKYEQKIHSQVLNDWDLDCVGHELRMASPTRETLYREVLTNLQVENFRNDSPTMRQLHYNYNIFKNVIVSNEFQSIFLSACPEFNSSIFCNLNNSQYKILSLYDRILSDTFFLSELKKLPLIYKLLKSVHLITKSSHSSRVTSVKRDVMISAIADELSLPFKNLLNSDVSIRKILLQIAQNFVNSILDGEYISLQTLSPIKIDSISFVTQLRKFIKLCINSNY